jgi:hypothetical protein
MTSDFSDVLAAPQCYSCFNFIARKVVGSINQSITLDKTPNSITILFEGDINQTPQYPSVNTREVKNLTKGRKSATLKD